MHTIQLNIDDSIFDKFMGLLEILSKDKVEVTTEKEYPSISFEEAKQKVQREAVVISSDEKVLGRKKTLIVECATIVLANFNTNIFY